MLLMLSTSNMNYELWGLFSLLAMLLVFSFVNFAFWVRMMSLVLLLFPFGSLVFELFGLKESGRDDRSRRGQEFCRR